MKRLLFSLALLSFTSLAFAQGINFESSLTWDQVKKKAKAENKYIFIDVFATWCGPCREMDNKIYPAQSLGSFMNERFISVKLQVDQTKSDSKQIRTWYADAARITSQYKIGSYPSFLFFSPEGYLVNQGTGFQSVESFQKMAESAFIFSKQYDAKVAQYRQGDMTVSELMELAINAKAAGDAAFAQKVATDCIDHHLLKLKSAELFTRDKLMFIGQFLGDRDSKAFGFFREESKRVNALLGDFMAERQIMSLIEKTYFPNQATWKVKKTDWDFLEKEVTNLFGPLGQEVAYGNRMLYHWVLADNWRAFGEYYMKYFKMALRHPTFHVNNMSWSVFEHIDDPEVLNYAIEVMKYDIETFDQNDFVAWDTYANLLHKVGRTLKAIEWETKAVKMVKGQPGENLYVEALEKMKKNLPTWKVSQNN